MAEDRPRRGSNQMPFDEALLSGYLDGELTQYEEQRVRVYLEDHSEARALLEEMKTVRETTRTTRFEVPDDLQWDERPRGPFSRFARGFGWLLILVWLVGVSAFGLWQLLTAPENLLAKLLVVGSIGGFALLLVSVLLDRLHDMKTDRYRRVRK